jgi:hypothetical protein
MPTIFRFFLVIGTIGALIFAGMVGLATFVEPDQRDIAVPVPPGKLNR